MILYHIVVILVVGVKGAPLAGCLKGVMIWPSKYDMAISWKWTQPFRVVSCHRLYISWIIGKLHLAFGYHRLSLGVLPITSTLIPKEEGHETIQSSQNLDRLPQNPFEKCVFRSNWPVIPEDTDHPFRFIVTSCSAANCPLNWSEATLVFPYLTDLVGFDYTRPGSRYGRRCW